MTYRGEVKRWRPPLGIKPTKLDRELVHTWSVMGIGTREMCARLGEKFQLGKPMAMSTFYWHFRQDLVPTKRGARWKPERLKMKVAANIAEVMQREIRQAGERGKEKK